MNGVRNLKRQIASLSSRVSIVAGANGQGKSSVLEAVYLLATTRSFRTRDPRQAIQRGVDYVSVSGVVENSGQTPFRLGIALGRGRGERRLSVGDSPLKLADYLGLLPVLFMAGESVRMIAGNPAERRRFIDRATAAAEPTHVADLSRYGAALAQRNRLLKDRAGDRELEPWEAVLEEIGDRIVSRRIDQIESWQAELAGWPELFPEGAQATLGYRRSRGEDHQRTDDNEPGETKTRKRWVPIRGHERQVGMTLIGPHRDDMTLAVGGLDLLSHGSAGQVRAAFSALTLAQARAVKRHRSGQEPLLLLDDLDTDLDLQRCEALLIAAQEEGQVIAATSKPGMLPKIEAAVLTVRDGEIVDVTNTHGA